MHNYRYKLSDQIPNPNAAAPQRMLSPMTRLQMPGQPIVSTDVESASNVKAVETVPSAPVQEKQPTATELVQIAKEEASSKVLDDSISRLKLMEDGKRVTFQRALLTYKTIINKLELQAAHSRITSLDITFWRAAHEVGKTGYEHTHVLVEWGGRVQKKGNRWADYGDIHPNIRYLPDKRALEDAKAYIGKSDPENADLKKLLTL